MNLRQLFFQMLMFNSTRMIRPVMMTVMAALVALFAWGCSSQGWVMPGADQPAGRPTPRVTVTVTEGGPHQ